MKLSRNCAVFSKIYFPKLGELSFHMQGKMAWLRTAALENVKLGTSVSCIRFHKVLARELLL